MKKNEKEMKFLWIWWSWLWAGADETCTGGDGTWNNYIIL